MRLLIPAMLVMLTACATPIEQCESQATEYLRRLDLQIVATRDAIARGTRPTAASRITGGLTICTGPSRNVRLCTGATRPLGRRIPIDLEQEQARLDALERARAIEASRARDRIAACRLRYPDSPGDPT